MGNVPSSFVIAEKQELTRKLSNLGKSLSELRLKFETWEKVLKNPDVCEKDLLTIALESRTIPSQLSNFRDRLQKIIPLASKLDRVYSVFGGKKTNGN